MPAPQLSLIIATYQESGNIAELLSRLTDVLKNIPHELIVVDDDSPDGTWRIAEDLARQNPAVKVIRRISDKGLSSAILEGFRAAQGGVLGVIDADLSHDEKILPELLRRVQAGADVAVGSRRVPGGGADHWPWYRRLTSSFATVMAKILVHAPLNDPMAGFFLVKRSVYEAVAKDLHPRGYKILLEIIARAKTQKVDEVPYIFRDRRSGYSKLSGFVILSYLEELCDLRWNRRPLDELRETYHRGRYRIVKQFLIDGPLLDLGCGRPCDAMPDGAFLREVGRGTGLDIKNCRIPFPYVRGDVHALPFSAASFKNITAMEILEHTDDLPRVINELNRVLAPGGHLVVTVPDDNGLWKIIWSLWTRWVGRMWEDTHHVHMTQKDWLKALSEKFSVVAAKKHWRFDLIFYVEKK
jgi:glycosyltransferase involved in cell wall biosynthesis